MKQALGILLAFLAIHFVSWSQTYLPMTAKESLEEARATAQSGFAGDVQLVQIAFVGTPSQEYLDMTNGKAIVWLYLFSSVQRDSSIAVVAMDIDGWGKQFVTAGGPPKTIDLNLAEIVEPFLDSPDAVQSFINGDAKQFLASHADAAILWADVIASSESTGSIPAGKHWLFRVTSSTDTLTCYLDATTGNSVYCSTTTLLEGIPEAPGSRLDQNFPNPVSIRSTSGTTIRYAVNAPQNVRLSVHDVLGREIAVLRNGFVEAGEYSITLPSSTFPRRGLHFYKLETSRGSLTKKLMVQD